MLEGWKPRPSLFEPYWLWQKRQHEMRVTDLIPKGVVFIGHLGVNDDFAPDGTGFFLVMQVYGQAFPYIVTAKHVIDQATGDERLRDVLIRVNTKAGKIEYVKTKPAQWHLHPDHVEDGRKRKYIDVAAFGLVNYRKWEHVDYRKWDFSFHSEDEICTDEIIKRYEIGLGDEVAIPGLFLSHIGTERNVPVLRMGTIAAMRSEPVPTSHGPMDAYLVEMRSVGGISGSPVVMNMAVRPEVLHPGTPSVTQIEKAPRHHFLFGLVHGHYTITTQDEWVFKTNQQVGDINAGIAIVVPVSKITETILQPSALGEEAEMAKRYQDAQNLNSKSVADSAPTTDSSDPAIDANPNHLKDFTRLVDVAARKRPQGGQT
jgi:hypothetical protein